MDLHSSERKVTSKTIICKEVTSALEENKSKIEEYGFLGLRGKILLFWARFY